MLSDDGRGQVLIYPYYTVQGGTDTLISVANGTSRGKAARVRFLEALNGRPVLALNLYLAPHDVWTAKITSIDNGGAKLVVEDASCTAPAIATVLGGAGDQAFSTAGFDGTNGTPADGEASQGVARTREGYIEVLEMGDIDPEYALVGNVNFLAAVTLNNQGYSSVPANCPAVAAEWASASPFPNGGHGALQNTPDTNGLYATTGGLSGTGTIINVAKGTDFSYDPVALSGFYMTQPPIHTPPASTRPSLADAAPVSTVTVVDANTGIPTQVTDSWTNSAAPGNGGIDAVSAVLMRSAVINEFVVNWTISAGTDWVVTLPSKRWYVDQVVNPVRPFSAVFATGGACEKFDLALYDQSGATPSGTGVAIPGPQSRPKQVCLASNVLTFNNSNVMGSQIAYMSSSFGNINVGTYLAGQASLTFPATADSNSYYWASAQKAGAANDLLTHLLWNETARQHVYAGLPIIGFAVQSYFNGMLPGGVLSNYGGTYVHRYERILRP
jgi:hypothetical protein